MKAIVYTKYGSPDVLHLKVIDTPVPGDNEVLVKIRGASVNAAEWHLLSADPFLVRVMGMGFLKPKNEILGADIAGKVEAVGINVKSFQPGDKVFGDIFNCGLGGFAEYVCAYEDAFKTSRVNFRRGSRCAFSSIDCLQGLRDKGEIKAGQKVLVNDASGGVGTFAVQIAKYFGAEVTAVCSARNLEVMRTSGADHVIDYAQQDFTKNEHRYDLILAANGYHSIFDYKRALNPKGIYVMSGGSGNQLFQSLLLGPFISMLGSKKLGGVSSKPDKKDLVFLKEFIEAGKVKPVIDRRYPLSEVTDAIRYLEEGHARGKVVITA